MKQSPLSSWTALLSWLVLLLCCFLHREVSACGGLFCEPSRPVVQAGEAITFGVNGNSVEMHVQILYEGPADGFSWVLPVPVTPEVAVGSDVMFTSLFSETLPTFNLDILDVTESQTCTEDDLGPVACPLASVAGGDRGTATVLDSGSVGPFDYVVLEPAENNPDSVFEWLQTFGYDQPPGADALLNYYALLGQKFVALKLTKNTEAGEIQPLILKYEMENATENMPIACVPIKLTAIAANDNMPVQVYVFADSRAVPLNYLDVTLDDTQVPWVRCLNNPACYDDSYREMVIQAMIPFDNHGFVTEYAGSSSVMDNKVSLVDDIDMDQLTASATWLDFLTILANAGVPAIPLVDSIIETYIPNTFSEGFCDALYLPNVIFNMANCFDQYVPPSDDWVFDAAGMAQEMDEKVFQPSQVAQDFIDSYSYMTRMYGVLSPPTMDKDPFFTLRPEAPDVSNVHNATAVPVCVPGQGPIALDVTIEGQETVLQIPAEPSCNGWRPTGEIDSVQVPVELTPALMATSWGFSGSEARMLMRTADGVFVEEEIAEVVATADALVVDQTVPPYGNSTGPLTFTSSPAAPSSAPDGSGVTTPSPAGSDGSGASSCSGFFAIYGAALLTGLFDMY